MTAELAPWVQALLQWYQKQKRALPWREQRDPYAIWIAEVMLQQTRTETVQRYYRRWLERFPDVYALAQADLEDVMRVWEGLGYYRRAQQLHRAAKEIVNRYQGKLPQDPAQLEQLPGIGPYTARAIASIAYGKDVAVLDGNVKRVLSRLFAVTEPADSAAGQRLLWELAQAHVPSGRASEYNQALMDLGATVCLPARPRCRECPLQPHCRGYALGTPESYPRKRRGKQKLPHYQVVAGVIVQDHRVLLARRPQDKLLGGLWEFPGGKVRPGETLQQALRRELQEELAIEVDVGKPIGVYRHAYSHFRITLHAFWASIRRGVPEPQEGQDVRWVPIEELPQYPMGKVDRLIARDIASMARLE